jgi:hypothetical protein
MRRRWGLALLALAGTARAQTAVIESTLGRGPSDVSAYLPEVGRGLGTPPPRSGAALAVDIELKFGAAPRRLPASALAEIGERVERVAQDLFYSGTRERRAIETLEEMRGRLAKAPGTLAHNPDARALYRRVLLSLIRAYQTNQRLAGESAAELLMKEVVASFVDLPVDPLKDGRALSDLYQRVLRAAPLEATLHVELAGGAGRVFLNERPLEGRDAQLAPGEYRVFVSTPSGDGRLHPLTVTRGETRLRIDVPFEVALETEEFVGFRFDSAAARARDQAGFVDKLGSALGLAQVVVLGAVAPDGEPAVALLAYGPGGELVAGLGVRGAAGAVPAARLVRAAELLARREHDGAVAREGLIELGAQVLEQGGPRAVPAAAVAEPAAAPPAPRSRALPIVAWTGLGLGLTLAVLGAHAAALDGVGTCGATAQLCARVYDTDGIGAAAWGVGALGALLSSTLLIAVEQPRRLRTVALVTAAWGVAALVGGALLLSDDQYPLRYDRDGRGQPVAATADTNAVAVTALALGGAHVLVGAALGIVDAVRARAPRATERARLRLQPSLTPTGAALSLAGSF